MKNFNILIFLFVLLFFNNILFGQYCSRATTNIAITPTTTLQYTPSYTSGHRVFNFSVRSGCTYEFSTCGNSNMDTYLRLYSTGTGGNLLDQNDDFCSVQSTITWTSNVTGTVSILMNRYFCNAINSSTRMSYRIVSCNPPACTTPISPSDGSTDVPIVSNLQWNITSGTTSYDVYFGTNSNPPLVTNTTLTNYTPTLNYNTSYYWKIVPKNSHGSAVGCQTYSFTTTGPGCLNAQYGQFPTTTYSPNCNNTVETITSVGYASEYSVVNLISGVNYTFSSSISTDYITISDAGGSTVLSYGTGSIIWTCPLDGNYRFYTHTNNLCGSSTLSRTRRIQCSTPPPPSNDLIGGAIFINTCGETLTGNTKFATNSDGSNCSPPQSPSENWTAPGVWYTIIGTGGDITVSFCNSSYDTKVFIYTGTPSNLSCYAQNDDYCGLQSEITFSTTVATTYYVLVTGYSSSKGSFNISVTPTPTPPIISSQPSNLSFCQGESDTLFVVTSGAQQPFSYQWYLNNTQIAGANTSSLIVSNSGNYHVIITNICGTSTQSYTTIVTVNSNPVVTLSSYQSWLCAGGSGTNPILANVNGGAPTYSYQWQYFGTSWINTGSNSNTINATPSITRNYRMIVSDINGCQSIGPIHTVNVVPDPINPTLNTKSPNQNTVCSGTNVSALINSGSDGLGCVDIIEYSTNGTTWVAYTSGTSISTTNLLEGSYVRIRSKRGNCTSGLGCTNNNFDILAEWQISGIPQISSSIQNVSCFGSPVGSINLTITGTSLPLQFNWSGINGFNSTSEDIFNLISGSYTVTVTNSVGCSMTQFNLVNSPSPVNLTKSYTNTTQNDSTGSIDLTLTGGIAPYLYSWSNGDTTQDLNNLPVGVYIVTIADFNSCSKQDTTTIFGLICPTQISEIIGTDVVCDSNFLTYTVDSLDNINYYNWSLPEGMIIVSGVGTNSIQVQVDYSFIGGFIIVNGQTSCGITSSDSLWLSLQPKTPEFSVFSLCAYPDQTQSFSVVTNGSNIIWQQPFGSVIMSGQNTSDVEIKFSQSFIGGYVEVYSQNNCGVSSINQVYVDFPPAFPTTIHGPQTVCNSSTHTFWVDRAARAEYYIWNVQSGATIIGSNTNDTIQIQFNNFISGSITVMSANACGSSTMRSLVISTITLPPPTAIFGPTNVCNSIGGSPVNYTTPLVSGITNYVWTAPSRSIIVSGQGTTSVNIQYPVGFTGGALSLSHSRGCDVSPQRTLNIISSQSSAVGSISGPTAVCNYTNGQSATYSIPIVSGVSSYNWSIPQGGIITNNGSNTVQISYPVGFSSATVSVTVVFNCGSDVIRTISVSALPQTTTIVGQNCITSGQNYTYTISGGSGATNFDWTMSGLATIVSGQNTNSVIVNFLSGFTTGSISLVLSNACGVTPTSTKTIGVSPLIPNSIFGESTICPGDTQIYYIDSYVGVNYLIWVFPSGITLLNGNTADTARVLINNSFQGGNVSVMSVNSCGSSPMRYKSLTRCVTPKLLDNNVRSLEEDVITKQNFDDFDFTIYPNPASDLIKILLEESEGYSFEITNSVGSLMMKGNIINKIDVSELVSGFYYFKLISKDGNTRTKRLVIK